MLKSWGKYMWQLTSFVKWDRLFLFFSDFEIVWSCRVSSMLNSSCFWRMCGSHVEDCALVLKQTCLVWVSFYSKFSNICYLLISLTYLIYWQFCRYQLGIVKRTWDQLQLDNELPPKPLEKLTGDFFLSLKLLNVSSVMMDIKHIITKNIHKRRVDLDKE